MKKRNSMENRCFHFLPNQSWKETSFSRVEKLHAPQCGALSQVTMETGGPGIPLGGTLPVDANTEGVQGESKLLDDLITALIIRPIAPTISVPVFVSVYACAEDAALILSLDKKKKKTNKLW